MLGVFLGEQGDGRILDEASAAAVSRSLSHARICVEARSRTAPSPAVADRLGAAWEWFPSIDEHRAIWVAGYPRGDFTRGEVTGTKVLIATDRND